MNSRGERIFSPECGWFSLLVLDPASGGNGIQENLADKARKLGIPVMKFEKGA